MKKRKRVPTQEELLKEWIDQAVDAAVRQLVETASKAKPKRRRFTMRNGRTGCGGW